jgi:hypothetical protein
MTVEDPKTIVYGTDIVRRHDARTFADVATHEQLVTSGDLTRATYTRCDFDQCPLCGHGVLTFHERNKRTGYVSIKVRCNADKCGCMLSVVVESESEIGQGEGKLRERWNTRSASTAEVTEAFLDIRDNIDVHVDCDDQLDIIARALGVAR